MLGNLDPKDPDERDQTNEDPSQADRDGYHELLDGSRYCPSLEAVLKEVDVLMLNDSEARQLSAQFSW